MGILFYLKKIAFGFFAILAFVSFIFVLGAVGASEQSNTEFNMVPALIGLGVFAISVYLAYVASDDGDEEYTPWN